MSRRDLAIGEIVFELERSIEALARDLYPGCLIDDRAGIIYLRPKSAEDRGSMQMFTRASARHRRGHWVRYSRNIGGNALNLIAYALSGDENHKPESYADAVIWAKRWLGLDRPESEAERRQREEAQARAEARREAEAARAARRTADHVHDIWSGGDPVDLAGDDPVLTYLSADPMTGGRGLDVWSIPHWCAPLRSHPSLWHWQHKSAHPAMVARLVHPGARGVRGVHCTFLASGGYGKAAVAPHNAKLMRGDIEGGFVPICLGPSGLPLADGTPSSSLVIAEGLETSIALACAIGGEARVWSALSIGNIASLIDAIRHPAIAEVIIAIENDISPQALRQRDEALEALASSGKPIGAMKSHVGSDFADLY